MFCLLFLLSFFLLVDSRSLSHSSVSSEHRAFFYVPTRGQRQYGSVSSLSPSNQLPSNQLPSNQLPSSNVLRKRSVVKDSTRHSFFFKPPRVKDNKKRANNKVHKGAILPARRKFRLVSVHLSLNNPLPSNQLPSNDDVSPSQPSSELQTLGDVALEMTNSPDPPSPTPSTDSRQSHTLTVVYWDMVRNTVI